MSTKQRRSGPARWGLRKRMLWAALALFLVSPSSAVVARAAETPPVATASGAGLSRAIESRYRVDAEQGELTLTPRESSLGVRQITILGESVSVNGERVSAGVLRAWLGEDEAAQVLRLAALSPAERAALLGLPAAADLPALAPSEALPRAFVPEPPEAPEAVEAPQAPEAPSAPEAPEPPDGPVFRSGSKVTFGSSSSVEQNEVARDAVAIGGSVNVKGEVRGDAVAVGGSAWIDGRVSGDVVAVGGMVHLGPHASVEGSVTSVGGRIEREQGARVDGEVSEVSFLSDLARYRSGHRPFRGWSWHGDRDWTGPWGFVGHVWLGLFSLLLIALFACAAMLVARGPIERAGARVALEPWKAGLAGLAAQLLILPLLGVTFVVLLVSIVGIPIALLLAVLSPFLFLGLLVLSFLGYTAVAHRLGLWLRERFGWSLVGTYTTLLAGVLAIQAWSFFGRLIGFIPGPMVLFEVMFRVFGFFVQYLAWTVGFGAVLLELMSRRARRRAAAASGGQPPPPLPPVPPTVEPAELDPDSAPREEPTAEPEREEDEPEV